jgi:hypothetical protein
MIPLLKPRVPSRKHNHSNNNNNSSNSSDGSSSSMRRDRDAPDNEQQPPPSHLRAAELTAGRLRTQRPLQHSYRGASQTPHTLARHWHASQQCHPPLQLEMLPAHHSRPLHKKQQQGRRVLLFPVNTSGHATRGGHALRRAVCATT